MTGYDTAAVLSDILNKPDTYSHPSCCLRALLSHRYFLVRISLDVSVQYWHGLWCVALYTYLGLADMAYGAVRVATGEADTWGFLPHITSQYNFAVCVLILPRCSRMLIIDIYLNFEISLPSHSSSQFPLSTRPHKHAGRIIPVGSKLRDSYHWGIGASLRRWIVLPYLEIGQDDRCGIYTWLQY